jgi:hypothetical protein
LSGRTNFYEQWAEALEGAGWYLLEELNPTQERWVHGDTGKGVTINPKEVRSRETVDRICGDLGIAI